MYHKQTKGFGETNSCTIQNIETVVRKFHESSEILATYRALKQAGIELTHTVLPNEKFQVLHNEFIGITYQTFQSGIYSPLLRDAIRRHVSGKSISPIMDVAFTAPSFISTTVDYIFIYILILILWYIAIIATHPQRIYLLTEGSPSQWLILEHIYFKSLHIWKANEIITNTPPMH